MIIKGKSRQLIRLGWVDSELKWIDPGIMHSLLELGHLQGFSINEIKDKDPDSILKHLADSSILDL